ncbi:acyltransferase family protein [Thermophagus sp. OGC60D27]|uniref:acyltransferase family protein n=1 Tax=Thermophagus sp. OGC60D27 TaxID=3458415 RepID=UPI004037E356
MEGIIINKQERFLSLDVFRGLTIALMILVNTPGTGAEIYGFLIHAPWIGFTLADLVFPSFLFAVGNSMSFSMRKMKLATARGLWLKILKRTIVIFLLGYLMYWFPFFKLGEGGDLILKPISETRIMGVLQRIALCYFFASILIFYLSKRAVIIFCIGILFGYWGILYFFGDPGVEYEMATNAASKFDLSILGLGHIYKKDCIPFDPEGLLSTLPSIVNVVMGYMAGVFIQRKGKSFEGVAKLLMVGFALTALAVWWNLVFPISKKLWTSSFVLYTVGLDLSIMAVLIYILEIKKIRKGIVFFDVFGKNSLFIYLFSELFFVTLCLIPARNGLNIFEWVSERIFQTITPGALGSLLTAIVYMLICWMLGLVLHKRHIYIKI